MLLLYFFHILCYFCYIISKFLNLEEEKYGNKNVRIIQGKDLKKKKKESLVIKMVKYLIATFVCI